MFSLLGKTELEEGEDECYYTSRKLHQHNMKYMYSYKRKQIVMRLYGGN